MADPTKYVPGYSYTNYQAQNPTKPLPAPQVDNDLANLKLTTDQTIDALKQIRKADGTLANGVVGPEQIKAGADFTSVFDAAAAAAASSSAAAASSSSAAASSGSAAASAAAAAISAAASAPYASRAALIAATVPSTVTRVSVQGVGDYERDDASPAPAATSNGGAYKWVPARNRPATSLHYGGTTPQDAEAVATVLTAAKHRGTPDVAEAPRLQVQKTVTPLNYDAPAQHGPVAVMQWSDASAVASNANRDAFVFRTDVTGNGTVALDGSKSGGSSLSIWRGLMSATNKAGDGSAHSFTAAGELQAVGPTGYNEHGMFIGSVANTGSVRGTIHGVEVLCRDGTNALENGGNAAAAAASTITLGAGASAVAGAYVGFGIRITSGPGVGQHRTITAYSAAKVATVDAAWGVIPSVGNAYEVVRMNDTYLVGVIARTARYFSGARESVSFLASAEGDINATAILKTSPGGLNAWNVGIDFTGVTFSSTDAIRLDEGHAIKWTDGTNNSLISVSAAGNMSVTAAAQVLFGTYGGAALPGIAWVGDASTGIFRNGSGVLAFTGLGVEGMRVNGNLGANPIHVRVNSTMKQVTEGAADSGGVGFKYLKVPN